MSDMKERFQTLDHLKFPEAERELKVRSTSRELPDLGPSPVRRASIVLVALVIGALGLILVFKAFHRTTPISVKPVQIVAHSNGKIAFLSGQGQVGSVFGLARVTLAGPSGTTPTPLSEQGNLTQVAWSPDGARIAYVDSAGEFGGGAIYLMAQDGSGRRKLVQMPPNSASLAGISWSPDGQAIAYSTRVGTMPSGTFLYGLFVISLTGGSATHLSTGSWDAVSPAWSPDGSSIAFSYSRFDDASGPKTVIALVNADGTNARVVTHPTGRRDSDPTWSPDGKWILFVSSGVDGSYQLEAVRPDGSDRHTIYRCSGDCVYIASPAWSPDGSKIAITIDSTPAPASQLIVMNADGSNPKPLRLGMSACCLSWQPVPLHWQAQPGQASPSATP